MRKGQRNPGNSGHGGYKMSRVVAIGTQGERVALSLECGHTVLFYPYHSYTAEEWAEHIQHGPSPFVIGVTRVRCNQPHESEVSV